MVETELEELLLRVELKVDVPDASIVASSLFSSRFVMVVSTQLVLAVQKIEV